ncbi:hypothetical protein ACHWUR_01865 [Klebsiella pneumoniae]
MGDLSETIRAGIRSSQKAIMIADLESYADIDNQFRCHKIVVDISGKFFLLVLLGCTVDAIEART